MADAKMQYHGQAAEAGKIPQNVPPMPANRYPGQTQSGELTSQPAPLLVDQTPPPQPGSISRGMVIQDFTGAYPRVRLCGNFGIYFCQNYQSVEYANISLAEARGIAWSLFGLCPHSIFCLDQQGQVLYQE